jgi:hypothetical protein
MSEIHIGPHTREDAAAAHGAGESHHTYDREINLKAIGKWMGGLLVLAVIIQILMWWFLRGLEGFDRQKDPELLPIEREMKLNEQPPPEPRLQVTPAFEKLNPDSISRSDVEDMQALRKREDAVLGTPAWTNQAEGRARVPIDVAMEVIASRGVPDVTGGAAGTVTPEEMRRQLPAGTSTGAPGATMQMTRPQTPAQPPSTQEQRQ